MDNRFTDWLLGSRSEYNSQARLLHMGVVIAAIATYAAAGINFCLGFSLKDQLGIILSGLPLFIILAISRLGKRMIIASVLFLVTIGVIVTFSWFAKGGLLGNTTIYFLIVPTLIFLVPKQWKFPALLLFGLLLVTLIISEFYHPELVNDYPSEQAHILDVSLSFLSVFGLLIFGNLTIKNELDHNREIAEESADKIAIQKASVDELNLKMTKLFTVISHDLKTPLANIKTTMELVRSDGQGGEALNQIIPKLDRDISLTINMLDNLLRWSKQQLSGMEVAPEILNLSESLIDTLHLVSSYAEIKHVDLNWFIPDRLTVNMDRESLKLVVRNLAINAVKYSHQKDAVTINCQSEDEFVVLDFVDTGVGISAVKLAELFELGHDSVPGTNNEVGAGLGLYLCKSIIEAYQGSLEAESTEGMGSNFRLRIPRGM